MIVENLKLHYNLVKNEKYQTTTYWVIIQSSKVPSAPNYVRMASKEAVGGE